MTWHQTLKEEKDTDTGPFATLAGSGLQQDKTTSGVARGHNRAMATAVKVGYKQFQGLNVLAFEEGTGEREKKLPRVKGIPDERGRVVRLGELLQAVELHNLKEGETPLWPLVWREDGDGLRSCTGVAYEFGRASSLEKTKKVVTNQEEIDANPEVEIAKLEEVVKYPNPNAGRFYLCHRVAQKDEVGEPLVTKGGKVKYDFAGFHWLDEHAVCRVFQKYAPALVPFLTAHGAKLYVTEEQLWPMPLLEQLFTSGKSDVVIMRDWRVDPYAEIKKRKATVIEDDGDEENVKPKGNGKRKRIMKKEASVYMDDEAEESDQ